jgi:2-dehydro-3-deoxy-L-rhamnonate dehydrogenase (NAD+)
VANTIDLEGRVAVVTGGAQGIGRAIAERFLQSGATVAVWDRDAALARETVRSLASAGTIVEVKVDVTDLDAVERARDETLRAFGRIDILVNNAGITGPNANVWDYDPSAWRQFLAINLDGSFHCCRVVVPLMIAQNYGRIVNMASVAGKEGNPNAAAYSASKAAIIRADQIARQGACRLRHCRQLHHAGCGRHRHFRPDDTGAHRLHVVKNSPRTLC